jgi:predicted nucleic acid-binding Zn ribbon protein
LWYETLSRLIAMPELPQHTHCQVCRKAIPTQETLCSEECKQQYEAMKKKNRMWVYVMYALMIFIIAVILISSL